MSPGPENRRVAVIGCGGLGNNLLAHLAGSGVGTVYFCDDDTVSGENLNRQFLFSHADIGRKKTDCVAAFFAGYAPRIRAVPLDRRILSPADLDFAADCDLLCVAADNNAVRRVAQEFCAARGIPLLNGGVQGFFGTAYLYLPGRTPCLDCAGLLGPETEKPVSVSCTVGVIGALCAELAVRFLTGAGPAPAGILHVYDQCKINQLKIKASPGCGVCKSIKE